MIAGSRLAQSASWAFLVAILAWLVDPIPKLHRRVSVDLETSTADVAVWYDSADGNFTESRHAAVPYSGRAVLSFELPDDAEFHRLDPGTHRADYTLHSIDVIADGPFGQRHERFAGAMLLAHLDKAHQARLALGDSDTVRIESEGDDPFFVVALPNPRMALWWRIIPRVVLGAILGVGVGVGVGVVIAFGLSRIKSFTLPVRLSERVSFGILFGALYAASLLPFALTPYPPLHDAGLHAAAGAIWHYYDDPSWHFKEYYQLHLGLAPYYAYYASINWLATLTGAFRAAWFMSFLAAATLPLACWRLLRVLELPRWPALLSFGFLYTFSFNWGFIAFCLSVNLALFSIAAFIAYLKDGGRWHGAFVAFSGIAIYFFHILGWGLWGLGLLTAGLVPARTWGWRRLVAAYAFSLPAVIVGALVTLRGSTLHMGQTEKLRFSYLTKGETLRSFAHWIWDACVGGESAAVGTLLLFLLVVLGVGNLRKLTARHAVLPMIAALCFACYMLFPIAAIAPSNWWAINVRFAMLSGLFIALSIGPLSAWRKPVFAACVMLVGWLLVDANRHWYETAPSTAGFQSLAKIPQPGDRVYFLIHSPTRDRHYGITYERTTLAGYYQSLHGGFLAWNYDEGFPLRYKARFPASRFNVPTFRWALHAQYYDYVMVYGDSTGAFSGHEQEVKQVGEANGWVLWKLPGPRNDTPPHRPYPDYLSLN